MPASFEPKTEILPRAQQEIWPLLAPAPKASFVLYGGTAVALYLGHRISIDFDFFRARPLTKNDIETSFAFSRDAQIIQESKNTLVLMAQMPSGLVKVSFFGGIEIGRINQPSRTSDDVLLVASLEDLLATKLEAILDRAESKDYRDIAEILSGGASLERGLGAFAKMYGRDPGLALRAIGSSRMAIWAHFRKMIVMFCWRPGIVSPRFLICRLKVVHSPRARPIKKARSHDRAFSQLISPRVSAVRGTTESRRRPRPDPRDR